jgi:putative ABC transport system substrate-binding protein
MMVADLVGKQLQILSEIVPKLIRVAIVWNPSNPSNGPQLAHAQEAARTLGIHVQPIGARSSDAIEAAFAAMSREHAQAVIVLVDSTLVADRVRIAGLAARGRLPAMYGLTDHVRAGGLMAYGANVADLYRRAATYVDKILRGARPADLPVEQPTKFELVLNLKTAKAMAFTFPPTFLVRADEVIE